MLYIWLAFLTMSLNACTTDPHYKEMANSVGLIRIEYYLRVDRIGHNRRSGFIGLNDQGESIFEPSLGKIRPFAGTGTGFVINKSTGLIATNKHVVKPWLAQRRLVLIGDEFFVVKGGLLNRLTFIPNQAHAHSDKLSEIRCKYVFSSPSDNLENDLALIETQSGQLPSELQAVNLWGSGDSIPQTDQSVFLVGYPGGETPNFDVQGQQLEAVLIEGRFRQSTRSGAASLLTYTMDTQPGSSGSPVFTEQNQVIGIHSRGFGKSLCEAISVVELRKLIRQYRRLGWSGFSRQSFS